MSLQNKRRVALFGAVVFGLGFAFNAQAQSAASETQRDVNQQSRIEQGLKSGELSTREASQLEQGEARIDRAEQRDMRNGSLSTSEKAQIQREQNGESRAIYHDDHNGTVGNPDSRSSERMQNDVGRDLSQEQRIHQGVTNGTLTNRETGRLEGGQAYADHEEYRAGRDGHVGNWGQRNIDRTQNSDSRQIYRDKHNGWNRR